MPDTILICDDEQLIRWSLSEHLQHEGYATIQARSGAECLKAVAVHAPSAVILDLKMPVMDGMTVLRTLGLPYSDDEIAKAPEALKGKTEADALIAYLQNLGTAVKSRR